MFRILYIGKLNLTLDHPNKNNDKIFIESQVHKTLPQYVILFDFILEQNIFSVKCNKKQNELWTHHPKMLTFAIHDGVSLVKNLQYSKFILRTTGICVLTSWHRMKYLMLQEL